MQNIKKNSLAHLSQTVIDGTGNVGGNNAAGNAVNEATHDHVAKSEDQTGATSAFNSISQPYSVVNTQTKKHKRKNEALKSVKGRDQSPALMV